VRFEWDEKKNEVNQGRHNGLDFETASKIFEDPNLVLRKERIDEETGEQRWHAMGATQKAQTMAVLLVVVHVYRSKNGEEIIRIISAREADKRDRRIYIQDAAD
jgi:uncharacterized protein